LGGKWNVLEFKIHPYMNLPPEQAKNNRAVQVARHIQEIKNPTTASCGVCLD